METSGNSAHRVSKKTSILLIGMNWKMGIFLWHPVCSIFWSMTMILFRIYGLRSTRQSFQITRKVAYANECIDCHDHDLAQIWHFSIDTFEFCQNQSSTFSLSWNKITPSSHVQSFSNLQTWEYATSTQIKSHSIVVRWNDAPIGHFLANYDGNLSFEYTIDIDPGPSSELGLKSVLYRNEDQTCNGNTVRGKNYSWNHSSSGCPTKYLFIN